MTPQPHNDTSASRERRVSPADRVAWAKERVISAARLLLLAMQQGDELLVYRLALGERLREHDAALANIGTKGPR